MSTNALYWLRKRYNLNGIVLILIRRRAYMSLMVYYAKQRLTETKRKETYK